ncbi:hypothetical protein [Roseibium sp.]|uniref:hypothetical protein n=1 Tax=Roseibium sp. TaxID=1936156 RepID=UPI003A9826E4
MRNLLSFDDSRKRDHNSVLESTEFQRKKTALNSNDQEKLERLKQKFTKEDHSSLKESDDTGNSYYVCKKYSYEEGYLFAYFNQTRELPVLLDFSLIDPPGGGFQFDNECRGLNGYRDVFPIAAQSAQTYHRYQAHQPGFNRHNCSIFGRFSTDTADYDYRRVGIHCAPPYPAPLLSKYISCISYEFPNKILEKNLVVFLDAILIGKIGELSDFPDWSLVHKYGLIREQLRNDYARRILASELIIHFSENLPTPNTEAIGNFRHHNLMSSEEIISKKENLLEETVKILQIALQKKDENLIYKENMTEDHKIFLEDDLFLHLKKSELILRFAHVLRSETYYGVSLPQPAHILDSNNDRTKHRLGTFQLFISLLDRGLGAEEVWLDAGIVGRNIFQTQKEDWRQGPTINILMKFGSLSSAICHGLFQNKPELDDDFKDGEWIIDKIKYVCKDLLSEELK